jgi:hypothetical protein
VHHDLEKKNPAVKNLIQYVSTAGGALNGRACNWDRVKFTGVCEAIQVVPEFYALNHRNGHDLITASPTNRSASTSSPLIGGRAQLRKKHVRTQRHAAAKSKTSDPAHVIGGKPTASDHDPADGERN